MSLPASASAFVVAAFVVPFAIVATESIASAQEDMLVPDAVSTTTTTQAEAPSVAPSFDDRWNASTADAPPVTTQDTPTEGPSKGDPLAHKRFVVARDFGVAIPVGELADRAAVMYGPLVRLGYQATESLELGVHAGYQRGFDREINGATQSLSTVPMTASVRYFVLGDRSGPYGGVEAGVNIFRMRQRARTSIWDVGADQTWARPCANVAVGYVYSKKYPIDVRAQVASLDLLSAGKGPVSSLTVGFTAGYSIFF